MIIKSITVLIFTFLSSLTLTYMARELAIKLDIGDVPNKRKIHKKFVPYLGGLGILISIILATGLSILLVPKITKFIPDRYYLLGLSCVSISLVGLVDDIKNINFRIKFVAQLLAAIVIAMGLPFDEVYIPIAGVVYLGHFTFPLVILWVIFITNAVNLLDGLDGLAGGVTIIALSAFTIVALFQQEALVGLMSLIIIFAVLGFMKYNYHPASVFMGDAGSLLLGFSISIISLEAGRIEGTNTLDILIPVFILIVPILDTILAFFRRLSKSMNPFLPDKEHIHHRLIASGLSHIRSVWFIYIISIIGAIFGVVASWLSDTGIVTIAIFFLITIIFFIRKLGYIELDKNLILIDSEKKLSKLGVKNRFNSLDFSATIQSVLFIVIDTIFITIAFFLSFDNMLEVFAVNKIILFVSWSILFWTILIGINDLYQVEWDTSRVDEIITATKVILFGTIVIFIVDYTINIPFIYSEKAMLSYAAFLIIGLNLGRIVLISILKKYDLLEFRERPTLIFGTSENARNMVKKIKNVPELKFNIVGFVNGQDAGNEIDGIPVFSEDNMLDVLEEYNIKDVIIALKQSEIQKTMDLLALFDECNVSVKLSPDFYNLLSGFKTANIYGVSLIKFFKTNMRFWEWIAKKIIDIVISLLVLFVLSPIWIIIGIAIVVDSKGGVFYKQVRIGKNGRKFNLIKFRTMTEDAEKNTGPKWAKKNDPRITRVGRMLRKLKIDEAPQFINVMMGDMSIIGPRPERPYFVKKLSKQVQFYSRRMIIKPGITGWAQIKHKYDESIGDVKEKLRYDLYYIENMSLRLDIKILIQTVLIIFQNRNRHH